MEPWEVYYEELRRRAGGARVQRFDREETIAQAAHEAYRVTADRLTNDGGWADDRVLVVTHAFGQTVKEWIARGGEDWEGLREGLKARWAEWR
jgi:hypothetical protein